MEESRNHQDLTPALVQDKTPKEPPTKAELDGTEDLNHSLVFGSTPREESDANRQPSPSAEASPKPDGNMGEGDGDDEAGPSGRGSAEDVGIGVSRRHSIIRPKESAGSVVWAKLAKYPWWPAQVLDPSDPWIPSSNETPRRGAIPVRFFGTYDFAWIENQRAVCPYRHNHAEHSSTSKQQVFLDAMAEAENFEATQELPNGFNEQTTPTPEKAPRKTKGGKGKGKKAEQAVAAAKSKKRGNLDESVIKQRSVKERQENILRTLVLAPPPESPFSHQPCLKGVRKLLEMQKAGLWPAPAPKPQPMLHQPNFLQFQGVQLSQPQQSSAAHSSQAQFPFSSQQSTHLQHQHFQQQVQQQLQHHASQQGQNPWFMQPNFAPQSGMHFFGQHGGVPGALLAAASQQPYALGHHFPAETSQAPKP